MLSFHFVLKFRPLRDDLIGALQMVKGVYHSDSVPFPQKGSYRTVPMPETLSTLAKNVTLNLKIKMYGSSPLLQ